MLKNREIKTINIGADNEVYLTFTGSNSTIQAKALELELDELGNPTHILFDRLLHNETESYFSLRNHFRNDGFYLRGCYVSEFSLQAFTS